MVRQRKGEDLENWLHLAEHSPIPELHAFTAGIRKDFDAVQAGLTLPWSQGPIEACIHKLKLIKRQGYGRASLAHLRARLLAGA